MTWSTGRQLTILFVFLFIILSIGGIFSLPLFLKAPTCTDGKQNGKELGVDCGGPCNNFCSNQVNEIKILWSRSFKVADGVFDSVAYIENQNFDAAAKKILYKFSLYDEQNILIAERVGKTYLTPNGKIAVFEGGIKTGERIPKRTFFEIAETPVWEKVSSKATSFSIGTRNIRSMDDNPEGKPYLLVDIFNKSIYNLSNIEVTALLYDENENVFAASRTYIDDLKKDATQEVIFTWLSKFDKKATRIEIIPRIDIFSINF